MARHPGRVACALQIQDTPGMETRGREASDARAGQQRATCDAMAIRTPESGALVNTETTIAPYVGRARRAASR